MGARDHSGLNRLPGIRRRAARVLWLEILARVLAPGLLLLAAYAAAALFGLASPWAWLAVLLATLGITAWRLRAVRPPGPGKIDRRIEAASGFSHRPLAALADGRAAGDGAIWAAHQALLSTQLARARAGFPAPLAAGADPLALRALLALLLLLGAITAGSQSATRLAQAFTLPAWPFPGPIIQAWVTPPDYTGAAPVLLAPGQRVTVLQGSTLSVIVDGTQAAIRYGGQNLPGHKLGDASRRADTVITASGVLRIGPWWHLLADFPVIAVPPEAPKISWREIGVRDGQLELGWHVQDAYGLAALQARLSPPKMPGAMAQSLALPAQTGDGQAVLEAGASPYAGARVVLVLAATNTAGVAASSAPLELDLPPLDLHDATARQIARARYNLALAPGAATRIGTMLLGLARAPPSRIPAAADVPLAALGAALRGQEISAGAAENLLFELIQRIEAGPAYASARALAQASQALLRELAGGKADAGTLQNLLAQLQAALAAHLAAMGPDQAGTPGQKFDLSALNQLAQHIAADEQAGRMAQAAAGMRQLQDMLRALRNARPMTAAEAERAAEASQAAGDLAALVRGQAGLLDQTAQGSATADAQAVLQQQLGATARRLAAAGMPDLPGMQGAARAMQAARGALAQAHNGAAATAETGAIQAMQQAAAALQARARPGLELGGMNAGGQDETGPLGTVGDYRMPALNQATPNAADEIEQEILRLDADPALPQGTHDYLRRLLTPAP